ncbi:hypothetical protein Y032_0071g613 [Ancylostoma ceylanicum]|uniref:Uncharacterized protein n=1 Tax=Ancylostoma ceylanicum TaxID=53326 RepID=A0A016TWC1_9BILA|nr:hypothetical protein Y032_0071g613 [Ancylostoma ceylanicum]
MTLNVRGTQKLFFPMVAHSIADLCIKMITFVWDVVLHGQRASNHLCIVAAPIRVPTRNLAIAQIFQSRMVS